MAAAHVLVVPYPSQGHINPMLEFAKLLAGKGPTATLVTTHFIANQYSDPALFRPVAQAAISDGHDEGGSNSAASLEAYLAALSDVGSRSLSALIEERAAGPAPFTCMVYDTFVPWAAEVSRRHGLLTAAFSTQSCTASAAYYYVNEGRLEVPPPGAAPPASVGGLPAMERWEFPSFALRDGSYQTLATFALNQFNLQKDDWVLFNSFDELESKVIEGLKREWRAINIGPCVPFSGGSQRMNLVSRTDDYDACMRWLDGNPAASTVYVSFGSYASLSVAQMEELAAGLVSSGKHFLWVVRSEEKKTLPAGFLERVPEGGLVVGWSPQLAVLSHPAVGCFLTHCGWNSTLEALSLGVPMVALAQWTDQPTNAKCVEDVWGVGLRARADAATGVVSRAEVERCVREVIEGGRREEIARSSRRWKELAREALSKGGSSDANLDEFVAFVNDLAIK